MKSSESKLQKDPESSRCMLMYDVISLCSFVSWLLFLLPPLVGFWAGLFWVSICLPWPFTNQNSPYAFQTNQTGTSGFNLYTGGTKLTHSQETKEYYVETGSQHPSCCRERPAYFPTEPACPCFLPPGSSPWGKQGVQLWTGKFVKTWTGPRKHGGMV